MIIYRDNLKDAREEMDDTALVEQFWQEHDSADVLNLDRALLLWLSQFGTWDNRNPEEGAAYERFYNLALEGWK